MKRVFVNEEVCMGCTLCQVYCRAQHARSKDIVKAFKKEPGLARLRVEVKSPASFAVPCRHCPDAPCVSACLTGALRQDATGIVQVDRDRCIGCWTCVLVCPVGAIRRDIPGHHIVKCDLCAGAEIPACVANCPNEALVYAEGE